MLRKFFESKFSSIVFLCIVLCGFAFLLNNASSGIATVFLIAGIVAIVFYDKKRKQVLFDKVEIKELYYIYLDVCSTLQKLGYENCSKILDEATFLYELAYYLCFRAQFGNALSTVDVAGSVVRTIYTMDKGKNIQMLHIFECVKNLMEASKSCCVSKWNNEIVLLMYPNHPVQYANVDAWLNKKGKQIVVEMFNRSVEETGDFGRVDLHYIWNRCRYNF